MNMKRSSVFVILVCALVLGSLAGSYELSAANGYVGAESTRVWKVDPLGVSPLLVGRWIGGSTVNNNGNTEITLQNPTKNTQKALIIYYDQQENFLECEVKVLTKHDIESFNPPLSLVGKTGAFEVVSTAARNISFTGFRPHGYRSAYGPSTTKTFQTESLHDGLVGVVRNTVKVIGSKAPSSEAVPLHQVNFRYFNPPDDQSKFRTCVCDKDDSNFNFLKGVNGCGG
jgi:hypothetical protein